MMMLSRSIAGDAMVLRYPFRKRVVMDNQIGEILRSYAPPGNVEVIMKYGEHIHMLFFSLGADVLHALLWTWHTGERRPRLTPPGRGAAAQGVPPRLLQLPQLNPPRRPDG